MRPSHGDFRPDARRRYVPSGAPRRRIPLIRIALLLGIAFFVFTRFDNYWPRVRDALNPSAIWRATFMKSAPPSRAVAAEWSRDSTLLELECRQGLLGACCEALRSVSPDLCGEAASLLARARWKGVLGTGNASDPVRLEARTASDEPGLRRLELSGLTGRDNDKTFHFRRRSDGNTWCESTRGCLGGGNAPALPLVQGVLEATGESGEATWISSSPWVRAALPGRVVAVDSTAKGSVVRVYHGLELYITYGPLRAAEGVVPGAAVKAGSHLGDAPTRGAIRALAVRVRKVGRNVDPAAFWNVRPSSPPASDPDKQLAYSETVP